MRRMSRPKNSGPSIVETVVAEIEQFCRESGISTSALGAKVVRDNKFFALLGRGIGTIKRVEKVRQWMYDHRARRK